MEVSALLRPEVAALPLEDGPRSAVIPRLELLAAEVAVLLTVAHHDAQLIDQGVDDLAFAIQRPTIKDGLLPGIFSMRESHLAIIPGAIARLNALACRAASSASAVSGRSLVKIGDGAPPWPG